MDQQLKLPLETGEPFPNGLTGWHRGRPPFIGWWDTRLILDSHQRQARVPLIQRRWWSASGWSRAVMAGDDDQVAEKQRQIPGAVSWPLVEWRGLGQPPKEGYPWALDEHHRSNLAAASRARVPLAV